MTLSTIKPFNYLVLSDIHLGARQTTYKEILDHLTHYLGDFRANSPFVDIDVLFIAGDLWDDTIEFSSEVLAVFIPWFHRLLRWCQQYDICLRILEGTPRHDRKQGQTLEKIAHALTPDLNFRYVQTLSIEKMEMFGLSVLYVPDECRHSADLVVQDTEQLLVEAGLQQVDIAIMHGMFQYQLGTIPMNPKVYEEATWLRMVKHYLSIGHVHTHSQYGRIVAQGSFDRLAHNEEAPKGGVLFTRGGDGEWSYRFIENTQAKLFKTFKVSGDADKALKQLDKAIKPLPDGSHVRIQAAVGHPILQGFDTLRQKYPLIVFTKKAIEDKPVEEAEVSAQDRYVQVVLNRETLVPAVLGEVEQRHNPNSHDMVLLRQLLEELVD